MSEKQLDALEVCNMLEAFMPQNDSALGARLMYEQGIVLSFPKVLEVSFLYVDLNAADLSAEPLGPFSCKTILALWAQSTFRPRLWHCHGKPSMGRIYIALHYRIRWPNTGLRRRSLETTLTSSLQLRAKLLHPRHYNSFMGALVNVTDEKRRRTGLSTGLEHGCSCAGSSSAVDVSF